MIGRVLLFGAGIIGFAMIVAAPDENSFEESDQSSTYYEPNAEASSDWYAGGHTLRREGDGHFYVSANVDGAGIHMMVDTGASVIALTADDAIAAGLDWDEGDIRHIGSGASGAVYGVPAQLDEVEIGGLVRHNVRAVIIPEGLGISLLGQSYLSKIGNVAIEGDEMVLGG